MFVCDWTRRAPCESFLLVWWGRAGFSGLSRRGCLLWPPVVRGASGPAWSGLLVVGIRRPCVGSSLPCRRSEGRPLGPRGRFPVWVRLAGCGPSSDAAGFRMAKGCVLVRSCVCRRQGAHSLGRAGARVKPSGMGCPAGDPSAEKALVRTGHEGFAITGCSTSGVARPVGSGPGAAVVAPGGDCATGVSTVWRPGRWSQG